MAISFNRSSVPDDQGNVARDRGSRRMMLKLEGVTVSHLLEDRN